MKLFKKTTPYHFDFGLGIVRFSMDRLGKWYTVTLRPFNKHNPEKEIWFNVSFRPFRFQFRGGNHPKPTFNRVVTLMNQGYLANHPSQVRTVPKDSNL